MMSSASASNAMCDFYAQEKIGRRNLMEIQYAERQASLASKVAEHDYWRHRHIDESFQRRNLPPPPFVPAASLLNSDLGISELLKRRPEDIFSTHHHNTDRNDN